MSGEAPRRRRCRVLADIKDPMRSDLSVRLRETRFNFHLSNMGTADRTCEFYESFVKNIKKVSLKSLNGKDEVFLSQHSRLFF